MKRLQGLIFDLDGTLVNSAPDLRQAINLTLAAHQRRLLTLGETENLLGDGMLPMLNKAFALTGEPIPDHESYKRFQEFISHYRSLSPSPEQIYPYSREMLNKFKDAKIVIGLCTNKPEASTLRLLDGLDIRKYFDFVAGGDTYQVHKPHPDHVRGVMGALKVSSDNCVMVGDHMNDVRAAHEAGIPCIAVSHGYGGDWQTLGADLVVDGFQNLEAAIIKLGYSIY